MGPSPTSMASSTPLSDREVRGGHCGHTEGPGGKGVVGGELGAPLLTFNELTLKGPTLLTHYFEFLL